MKALGSVRPFRPYVSGLQSSSALAAEDSFLSIVEFLLRSLHSLRALKLS